MKKIERILLAMEFSEASRDALRSAVFIAGKTSSRMDIVHVVPKLNRFPISTKIVFREVESLLKEIKEDVHRSGVSDTEAKVLFGNPCEQIIAQADRLGVSVIMTGSGEKEKDDRFPLGTTAENILRTSSKPVWIVKRGSPPTAKKILCPVDSSKHSRRALFNAIPLAEALGSELIVLTVIERLPSVYLSMGMHSANIQADWEQREQSEFNRFLSDIDFRDIPWKKMVLSGRPHEEILRSAGETGVDLIVMGSLGRTGLARILLGSVAEKVARELPCSIVMMKAEDVSRSTGPDKVGKRKPRKKYETLENL